MDITDTGLEQQVSQMSPDELAQLGLTPEVLQKIFQSGTAKDELAMMMRKWESAKGDADAQMPQGRQAGNVYRAANPLEFMGTALRNMQGRRDMNTQEAAYDARLKDLQRQRQAAVPAATGTPIPGNQPLPGLGGGPMPGAPPPGNNQSSVLADLLRSGGNAVKRFF